jgi:2-keto-4-pentenoate hydratase/2-oxohepta-3-ene-1,7-dioic acid hydratase in catechol pathway
MALIRSLARHVGLVTVATLGLGAAGVFAAWATAPDPRFNPASFEETPLVQRIAPLAEAVTLAQFRSSDSRIRTLLVLTRNGERVTGIDLAELGARDGEDPLAALAAIDRRRLSAEGLPGLSRMTLPIGDLLPAAPTGARHIGTGTNFPEHAREANSGAVFQFPKFGTASPARTTVRAESGILLDYEVEICLRFDRSVRSLADFDAAVKALFLCGDFTNRNALIHLADPDNLDSGRGFSDAKSGPDFFPTGPFLVVPRDWKTFVANIRMTTSVNGEPRQDARGREMTLDFRALTGRALGEMAKPRFLYAGRYTRLMPNPELPRDATLMSGTSEGTIFTPPTRADYIEAGLVYVRQGGPLSRRSALDTARQTFIANELAGRHYLQPGDIVRHGSNDLGDITIKVID